MNERMMNPLPIVGIGDVTVFRQIVGPKLPGITFYADREKQKPAQRVIVDGTQFREDSELEDNLLLDFGLGAVEVKYIESYPEGFDNLFDGLLHDEALRREVIDDLKLGRSLETFSATGRWKNLVWGLNPEPNQVGSSQGVLSDIFGDKAKLRHLLEEMGQTALVPRFRFVRYNHNLEKMARATYRLVVKAIKQWGCSAVVLKRSNGASGGGMIDVTLETSEAEIEGFFERELEYGHCEFFFDERLENIVDVSIQIRLPRGQSPRIWATSAQYMNGKSHDGNATSTNPEDSFIWAFGPKAGPEIYHRARKSIRDLVVHASYCGFYGYMGFDFIVTDRGLCYLTEINDRATNLTYAAYVEQQLRVRFGQAAVSFSKVEPVGVHRLSEAHQVLAQNSLVFNPAKGIGAYLANVRLLRLAKPEAILVACGRTLEEQAEIRQEAIQALTSSDRPVVSKSASSSTQAARVPF